MLDFLALVGRQLQSCAVIIAHRFEQQLRVLAGKFWICVRKGFECFVNIFAIIDAYHPVLKNFHRVFRGGAHFLVGVRFLNDRGPVRCVPGLIRKIIERDDCAFECGFAQVLHADLIERLIRRRDCILHRGIDRFGRLLPIGNRQNGICFGSSRAKIIHGF